MSDELTDQIKQAFTVIDARQERVDEARAWDAFAAAALMGMGHAYDIANHPDDIAQDAARAADALMEQQRLRIERRKQA